MRKTYLFLLALLFTASFAQGQSKNSIALVQAVQQLNQLMINPQASKLKDITHKKLSYGHSSGRIENQTEFIAALVDGQSDFVSIDLQNQTYEVDGEIGIARHILSASTNDGGQPGTVRIGIMMIWQDTGTAWKLLARQAYKLP
ncbi:hypothetical protein GCM10007049_20410 [Echinicola pacifica]|uniref:DUF4440 domain-containing protein n=1 Tax=Echinicola pacifica TaxID=346377 RepID=A0A918PYL2_9BACT|nr:nuclear transport factor 2 family protein [Echinicola pacifica]GGZ27493.1 hypothetical protein GCM10007049_20410 [Echinicola pacifica]